MKRDKNHCCKRNYAIIGKSGLPSSRNSNNFRPRKTWRGEKAESGALQTCKRRLIRYVRSECKRACTIIGAIGNWMRGVNRPIDEWNMIPPLRLKYGRRIRSIDSRMFTDFPSRLSPPWFFDDNSINFL